MWSRLATDGFSQRPGPGQQLFRPPGRFRRYPFVVKVNGAIRAAKRHTGCGPLQPVATPDHVQHDLVGAGADPVETNVAVGALDLVLLHVAVAAEDLHAL